MTRITLAETAATLTAADATTGADGSRLFRARIIEGDRWGSSGYYPAEVIERDGPTTWPAGTHMFLDHPGENERYDRPERSVRDLAGVIASAPVYESANPAGQGLYADVKVLPHWAPVIEALADNIGLSIRGSAAVQEGERDGRTGPIITELGEGISVDFVTRAGAGGKLTALIESARGTAGTPLTEALPGGHTADTLREALDAAIQDAYGSGDIYCWVRDYTDTWVVYSISGDSGADYFQQDYTATDTGAITLTGTRVQVIAKTTYTPAPGTDAPTTPTQESPTPPRQPAGSTPITETQGGSPVAEIEEGRLRELQEAERTSQALQTQLAEAHRQLLAQANTATVARLVEATGREHGITFTALEVAGLTATATLTESGAIDEAALTATLTTEATTRAAAAGAGQVTGFGATPAPFGGAAATTLTESERDRVRGSLFNRRQIGA